MYRSKTSFLLLKGMYVFWMCEKSILVANASDLVVPCCYHLYCNIVCFHWYIGVKKKKKKDYFICIIYYRLSCYRNTWLSSHSNTDTRIVHLVVGRGVFENMVILRVLMLLSCIYRNISNPFNSACVCFPLI